LDIATTPLSVILKTEVISTGRRLRRLALLVLAALPWAASAEEWSHARIGRLPDSAFAVVETAPDERKVRHLPHHDESGGLDLAHLKAARARLGQVKWLDPGNAEVARRHLDEHWRALREGSKASTSRP
jgi:hypothetical protein